MKTKLIAVAIAGSLMLAGCSGGGGGGGLSAEDEQELRDQVAAAEKAQEEAEAAQKKAEEEAAAARRQAEQEAAAVREQERQRAEQEREQLEQQLTEAQQAELRARASAFGVELDDAAVVTADVSWPRGGSLTLRPSGVTFPSGSAAPAVPGNWRNASFTGQTGTAASLVDETVYLYTNIQAAGTRAFWKKYGGDDLEITQQQVTDGLVKPGISVSRTRETPGDSNTPFVSATTGGTYDGVSGRFSCDGDETVCTVTRSEGTTTIAGTWTFEATNPNSGAPVDGDDAYLYFGIWSSIPANITGAGYDFEHIVGGGAQSGSDLTGFGTLTGSATFRGGAIGKYVLQGQVGGQNAKIGTFTATATLNANFGDVSAEGTLSGRITDFQEGGNSLAGWQVTLGRADNVGAAADISSASVATQTNGTVADFGGVSAGGSWGATFYGSANNITGLTDREKYPAVDLAGVAGWFNAGGAAGAPASLAGAFAATPSR